MKLVSFIVRGLGGRVKKKEVKEMVKVQKPDLLCIQESKLEEVDQKVCSTLWEGEDFDWVAKNAVGRSGGLLMLWRKGSFSLSYEFQGDNFLGVVGLWGENQVQVSVVNVYAPCDLRGKRRL